MTRSTLAAGAWINLHSAFALFQRDFLSFSWDSIYPLLLDLWHLLLIGALIIFVAFWVYLACYIGIRLVRRRSQGPGEPSR